MIKARGVSKSFGPIHVLEGIDVDIPMGEITAIVGPNASGKTTFNRILLGLVQPDAGEILFDGDSIIGQSAYRERIGYMPISVEQSVATTSFSTPSAWRQSSVLRSGSCRVARGSASTPRSRSCFSRSY
jgi:ABC-type Mn2+/Zn2+ transport system ATPase subunit